MREIPVKEMEDLVARLKIVMVSSVDESGYPNTKAMFNLRHEGFDTHYFSTNVSSMRRVHFQNNRKACIYFCDDDSFQGLMLVGTMEVMTDAYHKELLWKEGDEIYYPDGGVISPDYCVLRFTAERGNYYHGLMKMSFSIEELRGADR